MHTKITFSVRGETFAADVIRNPFMFGRAEVVDVQDNKTGKIVPRTVKVDTTDGCEELFFTWNGKKIIIKEKWDHFECYVR